MKISWWRPYPHLWKSEGQIRSLELVEGHFWRFPLIFWSDLIVKVRLLIYLDYFTKYCIDYLTIKSDISISHSLKLVWWSCCDENYKQIILSPPILPPTDSDLKHFKSESSQSQSYFQRSFLLISRIGKSKDPSPSSVSHPRSPVHGSIHGLRPPSSVLSPQSPIHGFIHGLRPQSLSSVSHSRLRSQPLPSVPSLPFSASILSLPFTASFTASVLSLPFTASILSLPFTVHCFSPQSSILNLSLHYFLINSREVQIKV
jgi:hypothetical protein